MHISVLFLFFLLHTVLAAPLSANETERRSCGNDVSEDDARSFEEQFRIDLSNASRNDTDFGLDRVAPISVVWHVVYATAPTTVGNLPDSAISS
ncbi:hypothetical protein FS842_004606, partial [Serendipita sp. 407]